MASQEAMTQNPALVAPSGRIDLTSVASPGDVQVKAVEGASRLADHRPTRLGSVLVADGAQVNASGTRGGTIHLEAEAITLTNGVMVVNGTSGVRPGGDILVRANALTLSTGAGMVSYTTAPESAGHAGNVGVEAQTVMIRDGSFLSSIPIALVRVVM
jgi:hypothetical protein